MTRPLLAVAVLLLLPAASRAQDYPTPVPVSETAQRSPAAAARASRVSTPLDRSPVVRAAADNWGLFFKFGGLAGLTHSNTQVAVGPLLFNHVGLKYVFSEQLMLPIWFGTGLRVDSPSQGDAATNWGMSLGAGLEYHFRIWRRISPFFGGVFGLDFRDPAGPGNFNFGTGMGPTLGVEYYIGDRLSLTASYMFLIQIIFQDGANSVTTFGINTLAGGALNINYYF